MGHIKEPDGVDLVINSRPLTKEEESAISNYIRAYKAKRRRVAMKQVGKNMHHQKRSTRVFEMTEKYRK